MTRATITAASERNSAGARGYHVLSPFSESVIDEQESDL
jgi:hypothetical protein